MTIFIVLFILATLEGAFAAKHLKGHECVYHIGAANAILLMLIASILYDILQALGG